MKRIKLKQDIVPLSKFRAHVAEKLLQVQGTGRPIVITQHGESKAVLLSAEEYDRLLYKIEILQGVNEGLSDIVQGRTVSHAQAAREMKEELRKSIAARAKKTLAGLAHESDLDASRSATRLSNR